MNIDQRWDLASEILGIVAFQDRKGHWRGKDKDCGSDAQVMKEAMHVLDKYLGPLEVRKMSVEKYAMAMKQLKDDGTIEALGQQAAVALLDAGVPASGLADWLAKLPELIALVRKIWEMFGGSLGGVLPPAHQPKP